MFVDVGSLLLEQTRGGVKIDKKYQVTNCTLQGWFNTMSMILYQYRPFLYRFLTILKTTWIFAHHIKCFDRNSFVYSHKWFEMDFWHYEARCSIAYVTNSQYEACISVVDRIPPWKLAQSQISASTEYSVSLYLIYFFENCFLKCIEIHETNCVNNQFVFCNWVIMHFSFLNYK